VSAVKRTVSSPQHPPSFPPKLSLLKSWFLNWGPISEYQGFQDLFKSFNCLHWTVHVVNLQTSSLNDGPVILLWISFVGVDCCLSLELSEGRNSFACSLCEIGTTTRYPACYGDAPCTGRYRCSVRPLHRANASLIGRKSRQRIHCNMTLSIHAVIGQFSAPYSTVRPAKI